MKRHARAAIAAILLAAMIATITGCGEQSNTVGNDADNIKIVVDGKEVYNNVPEDGIIVFASGDNSVLVY